MRNKAKVLKPRGKGGHRGLRELCKQRAVKKTDIARALQCSDIYVNKLCNNPHILNILQLITIAGLLGVNPEFLLYVIRFNDHSRPHAAPLTTEMKEDIIKFPI